ncbi:MAG: hypothetical protein WBY44_16035 [Bryobacteraceae bacterium]
MPRKPSDLSTVRLMKEKALARMRLSQAMKLEGRLLDRELVVGTWSTVFASLRDRAMAMPDRIAARGANRNADELRAIVSEEVRDLLEAVSSGRF